MKAHFLSLLLGLCLLFSACKKTVLTNGKAAGAKSDETTQIELNDCRQKTYGSEIINLCLKAVQDSRCPSNVVCVWQGLAKANFTLTINGQPHDFVLATSNVLHNNTGVTIENYKIALLNVLPYPNETTPAKRIAEVRITKL